MNTQSNNSQQLQSFKLYSGRAPLLIRITSGLLWLGAAGLLVFGVVSLLTSPSTGVLLLAIGIYIVVAAKSLFKMKKAALYHAIILGVFLAIGAVWQLAYASGKGQSNYFLFVYVVLLLFSAFKYKDQFVN